MLFYFFTAIIYKDEIASRTLFANCVRERACVRARARVCEREREREGGGGKQRQRQNGGFNPLPNDKILDRSKLKHIADEISKCI